MVLDFPKALYIPETLEHGINCVKVDLLFLDYHQTVDFCHNFEWFISGDNQERAASQRELRQGTTDW